MTGAAEGKGCSCFVYKIQKKYTEVLLCILTCNLIDNNIKLAICTFLCPDFFWYENVMKNEGGEHS